MIIDSFNFFNELDILEIRLNILDSIVDKFVLIECSKTQSLLDKPYYYEENKELFSKFAHKIIHVIVDDCPLDNPNSWKAENFQRDCILRGLKQVPNISSEDIVMISDLDEIPRIEAVKFAVDKMSSVPLMAFEMEFYAYYLNLWSPGKKWVGTVMTKYELLEKGFTPQELRNCKDSLPRIKTVDSAGFHFSWLGGWEKVYEKFISCIEPFDKTKVPPKDELENIFRKKVIEDGKFNLIDSNDTTKLEILKNYDYLPQYIKENMDKYKHLFLQD